MSLELRDVMQRAIDTAVDRDPPVCAHGVTTYPSSSNINLWADVIVRELRDAAKANPGILEPLLHDA